MKSLLEVQQSVRELENKVADVTESIKEIYTDIDEMRNGNQNTDIDYSKIEIVAKQIDFGKHHLDKLNDGRACQIYLEMLLIIIRMDFETKTTMDRLIFIQWLLIQSRIDWSLEELVKDCYKIKKDSYHEFVDIIPKKYRENFMVDALIVANIGGTANKEILEYLAGLSAVLGIDKETIRILSLLSRIVLCQNIEFINKKYKYEVRKHAKDYRFYVGTKMFEKGCNAQREIVIELSDDDVQNFKWKVKQMQKVEKGDVIATYRKAEKRTGFSFSINYFTEEIQAPLNGTIFEFRDRGINYGVIAHENDNKDSIKAWVMNWR